MRRGGALLALATALLAAGCGTGGISKAERHRARARRSSSPSARGCHTLADAGSHGNQGPNLDDAFAYSRKQGFKQETIEQVVRDQIELAVPPMPQNLVKGADADAVAAYVAMVAGKPVAAKNTTNGKDIFTANCGSCHTLKDAGTNGTVGPEPRPAEAEPRDRPAPGDQRRRRDAGLQGHAHAGPDHRGREVRLLGRRQALGLLAEVHHDVVDRHREALARLRRRDLARASSSGPPDASRSRSRRRRRSGARPRSPAAGRRRRPRRTPRCLPPSALPRLARAAPAPAARAGSSSEARWRSGEFSAGLTTCTFEVSSEAAASSSIFSSSGAPPTVSLAITRIRCSPGAPPRTPAACRGAAGWRELHHHQTTAIVRTMKTTSPAQALITPAIAIAAK